LQAYSKVACIALSTLICAALGPLSAADEATAKKYEQMVDRAIAFLATKGQADDGSFNAQAGPAVTALVTTAVLRHGRSPEDPLVAKALRHVERFVHDDGGIYEGAYNRNYETCIAMLCFKEANRNDGGSYYTPAAGGNSQAGNDDATGGLRSYASMTYAGLKSMIYAGLKPDDDRVKAAITWLKKHYDLNSNPGLGDQGLYYYYMTFAKALSALGHDTFVDDKGAQHDWRKELIDALAARQRPDGSWINENSRWLEGDANLSTGYALLALSYCRK